MSQPRDRASRTASHHAAVSSPGAYGHHQPHTQPQQQVLDRARSYLARLPVSVQGQGGHLAAFKAAGVLVKGFALPEHEALPLLLEWNTNCQPPWQEAELRHKLRSATTAPSRHAPGHLLQASSSASSSYPTSSSRKSAPPRPPAPPAPTSLALPLELAKEKARQRAAWPALEPLTHDDIRTIAALRGILPDAVDLAHRWGFLKTAVVEGHRCFIIRDGTFAQARRLDGLPFKRADGTTMKAKNLCGSHGTFLGRRWLGTTRHVLLVEGCIGLVEALAALALVNTAESWTILAATSASARFCRDPELLTTLKHRHVRILPDKDPTGFRAAMSWAADLQQARISKDAYPLPPGCNDLGDLLALPATEERQRLLDLLFLTP